MPNSKNQVQFETSGIYVGTLLEDMSETVNRVGYLAVDVLIEKFWTEDVVHPLAKVYAKEILPLFKDDKVLIKFQDNNFMYPYLYYIPKKLELPEVEYPKEDDAVSFPTYEDEDKHIKTAEVLDSDSFILHCDGFSLIQYGDQQVFVSKKGVFINASSDIGIKTEGNLQVEAKKFTVNKDQLEVGG